MVFSRVTDGRVRGSYLGEGWLARATATDARDGQTNERHARGGRGAERPTPLTAGDDLVRPPREPRRTRLRSKFTEGNGSARGSRHQTGGEWERGEEATAVAVGRV